MADFEKKDGGMYENHPWEETKRALTVLEGLLNCFICRKRLNEPQSIGSCNHHFCKSCIERNFNNSCPECGLPAWRRDITVNHQLASIVNIIGDLHGHIYEASPRAKLTTSCDESVTSVSSDDTCKVQPTELKTEFRTPKVTSEMIQNHILSRLGPLSTYGGEVDSCGIFGNNLVDRSPPGYCQNTVAKAKSSCTDVTDMVTAENPDFQLAKCQLQMSTVKRKRRKRSSLHHREKRRKIGDLNDTGFKLPFTPIVAKTRHFAQMKTLDRISRLKAIYNNLPNKGSVHVDCSENSQIVPTTPAVTKTRHFAELTTPDRKSRVQAVFKHLHTHDRESRLQAIFKKLPSRSASDVKYSNLKENSGNAGLPPTKGPTTKDEPECSSSGRGPSKQMKRNVRGETPLHLACIKGCAQEVIQLLRQGFDPNTKDYAGWTPLHEACNHGYYEIVTVLLDHGALVNVPGYNNETPLHDAVLNDHPKIVKLLLSRGADIELRNKYGLKALDYAQGEAVHSILSQSPLAPVDPGPVAKIKSQHASPLLNGGPSSVVLLSSSLSEFQKIEVACAANKLKARVANKFTSEVTHLITTVNREGCCPRTMKYFYAIAYGVWIVSYEWLSQSQKSGNWVDESSFEAHGASTMTTTYATLAPKLARENKALQNPGLFDGCDFYLTGNITSTTPSKAELIELIRVLDGHVLTREPREDVQTLKKCPFHAESTSMFTGVHTFILFDPASVDEKGLSKWKTFKSVAMVPVAWLLDCITHYQLRPLVDNRT